MSDDINEIDVIIGRFVLVTDAARNEFVTAMKTVAGVAPISYKQIIEVLIPFAAIKISEQGRVNDVVFPKISAQAVKDARNLMDALRGVAQVPPAKED